MPETELKASKQTYAGLFLLVLATLVYEILLTRIFSVTTWYHFAFLAISLAMLGMTLGAVIVYLRPLSFPFEKTVNQLSASSLYFAIYSVAGVLIHLYCPYLLGSQSAGALLVMPLLLCLPFTLIAFIYSGIAVSLALTRFPKQVNTLYATDLIGAACGCIFLVVSLNFIDGITEVFVVALFSCLAACLFARRVSPRLFGLASLSSVLLAAFVIVSGSMAYNQSPLLKPVWVKGSKEGKILYQRWNSFSRIRVFGDPDKEEVPKSWGLSPKAEGGARVRQVSLDIDGNAMTPLFHFDGTAATVGHLRYEMPNLVHYLRHNASVLVIGVGGGKDIMTALIMNQKHVTGVELNGNILDVLTRVYGDFTGHLDQNPKVTLVNDEARSYVTRSSEKFDIIQISMIDTWAATASGAYSLSENGLYTLEAWSTLLQHLSDNGILTVCRWYHKDTPAEFYRLTALAAKSLKDAGVKDPGANIAIVRLMPPAGTARTDGVGTLLVSKQPFSDADLDTLQSVCRQLGFDLIYAKGHSDDPVLQSLATGDDPNTIASLAPFNIQPPRDDSPFFFQTLRWSHLTDGRFFAFGANAHNIVAALFLMVAAIVVPILSLLCFAIPLLLTTNRDKLKGSGSLFCYFAAIGAGYMFVEMSQLQKLNIFLGHPVYGISVVLFALLLSTGLGSLLTSTNKYSLRLSPLRSMILIVVTLTAFGIASPIVISMLTIASIPLKIAAAVLLLFPLGLVLGIAFPTGMRIAAGSYKELAPWFWGINGATSVSASVIAVAVAMWIGISAAYWLAVLCYLIALIASITLKPAE